MNTDSVPQGFKDRPDWRIFTNGKEIVILGDPGDGEDADEENAHNCDAMGCVWEHVLFRFDVPAWQKVPPIPEPQTPRNVTQFAGVEIEDVVLVNFPDKTKNEESH